MCPRRLACIGIGSQALWGGTWCRALVIQQSSRVCMQREHHHFTMSPYCLRHHCPFQHFICWSTWLRSNRRNFEHKDEINHCWTRSGWEPSVSLFPQSFLICNPPSLLRLKDVLGQRSQCSSRKPPHASPQYTVKNTILTHCCYLGPTWKFHHSCKVYKMADHSCSAAKIYQVVKWKQCLDAVRQYICV